MSSPSESKEITYAVISSDDVLSFVVAFNTNEEIVGLDFIVMLRVTFSPSTSASFGQTSTVQLSPKDVS